MAIEKKTREMIANLEHELHSQIAKGEDRQLFSGICFDGHPASFEDYVLAYGEYLRRSKGIRK